MIDQIYEGTAQRLQAGLSVANDLTKDDAEKITEICDLAEKADKWIKFSLAWKANIFGPNFRSPQSKRIEQIENIAKSIRNEILPPLHSVRDMTSPVLLAETLATAKTRLEEAWRLCLNNAAGRTMLVLGGSIPDRLRGLRKMLGEFLLVALPVLLTGAFGVGAYFYQQHHAKTHEVRNLLMQCEDRMRECRQLGDRLTNTNLSSVEVNALRGQIAIAINGTEKSNAPALSQFNWRSILLQLELNGLCERIDEARSAIDEINHYFIVRDTDLQLAPIYRTNDFHPQLKAMEVFLEANKKKRHSY